MTEPFTVAGRETIDVSNFRLTDQYPEAIIKTRENDDGSVSIRAELLTDDGRHVYRLAEARL